MSWTIDFTKTQFTFASVTGEIIPYEKSDETIAQGPSQGLSKLITVDLTYVTVVKLFYVTLQ